MTFEQEEMARRNEEGLNRLLGEQIERIEGRRPEYVEIIRYLREQRTIGPMGVDFYWRYTPIVRGTPVASGYEWKVIESS